MHFPALDAPILRRLRNWPAGGAVKQPRSLPGGGFDARVMGDLEQETLAKGLANLDKFEPGTRLKSWLFTIMRRTISAPGELSPRNSRTPARARLRRLLTVPTASIFG